MTRRHTCQPLSSLHVCESTQPSPREHQHNMPRCMARGWQAWLRHRWSAARAKRVTLRALATPAATARCYSWRFGCGLGASLRTAFTRRPSSYRSAPCSAPIAVGPFRHDGVQPGPLIPSHTLALTCHFSIRIARFFALANASQGTEFIYRCRPVARADGLKTKEKFVY